MATQSSITKPLDLSLAEACRSRSRIPRLRAFSTQTKTFKHALQGLAQDCKSRIFWGTFFTLLCSVLHRIAFPVVSKWSQEVQVPSLTFQAQVDRSLLLIFRHCS